MSRNRKGALSLAVLILLPALGLLPQGCTTAPGAHAPFTFYPAAPDTARYQFLRRISTSKDVHTQSWFHRLVLGKSAAEQLGKPYGVTIVGPRVYVADTQLNLVVRIDLEENDMRAFGAAGPVRFSSVINVEHDELGNIYVADPEAGRVIVMDQEGELIRTYGKGMEIAPLDVGIGRDELYVVDRTSRSVHRLDRETGESLGRLDTSADSLGMAFPTNVAVASDGSFYVVDTVGCRILRFGEDGDYTGAFGSQGYFPGTFTRPKGVAVDPDGLVFVVDAAFENLQIFDQEGRVLTFLGGPGEAPGNLWLPAAVALSRDLAPYLSRETHPDAEIDYVVAVTSQFGPARIDFYGRIANSDEFARVNPPDRRAVPDRRPGLLPAGELPPDPTGASLGDPGREEENGDDGETGS